MNGDLTLDLKSIQNLRRVEDAKRQQRDSLVQADDSEADVVTGRFGEHFPVDKVGFMVARQAEARSSQ